MPTIGISGKGGTGKTTISGLIIRYLLHKNLQLILAVDADPASNLNSVLGVEAGMTVSEIVEKLKQEQDNLPAGMSKPEYINFMLQSNLIEAKGFDLLVMGRPEGQGCYCSVNNFLRVAIDQLAKSYKFVIIDNEAGMEHLSRKTTAKIDLMVIVSDPSYRGIRTAGRIKEIIKELNLEVKKDIFIINRLEGELNKELLDEIESQNLKIYGTLPADPLVNEYDRIGKPLFELPLDSPISTVFNNMWKYF